MMRDILIYFFVALGLSMDAFSLAIVYGVSKITFMKMLLLSLCVGVFHFFMPILGGSVGVLFQKQLIFSANIIVSVVFFIIAISMIRSLNEDEEVILLSKFYHFLFFAFTVSLDSLSVGIAYGILKEEMLLAALIFSIISFIFTFLGVLIGNYFGKKFGKCSKVIGALILFFLGLKYLILS